MWICRGGEHVPIILSLYVAFLKQRRSFSGAHQEVREFLEWGCSFSTRSFVREGGILVILLLSVFPSTLWNPFRLWSVSMKSSLLRTTRFTLYMSVVSVFTYPLWNVYPTIDPKEAFANQTYRGKVVLESSLVSLVALDRKRPSPTQRPVQMRQFQGVRKRLGNTATAIRETVRGCTSSTST